MRTCQAPSTHSSRNAAGEALSLGLDERTIEIGYELNPSFGADARDVSALLLFSIQPLFAKMVLPVLDHRGIMRLHGKGWKALAKP